MVSEMKEKAFETIRAVYLTAEDLRLAASIIFNAYHDDPLFKAILVDISESQYEQKLRAVIREELNKLWQQEQHLIGLFQGKRLLGVLGITTQGEAKSDWSFWQWRIKMLAGTGWQATQSLIDKDKSIASHLPSKNCGMIQFMCINPCVQGEGLGRQLLETSVSWCNEQPDLDGLGVFVNQANLVNLFNMSGFMPVQHIEYRGISGQLLFYPRHDNQYS